MGWAIAQGSKRRLPRAARMQLVVLANFANGGTGEAWPGKDLIAELTGNDLKTVYRMNRLLVDEGLITLTQRGKSWLYKLCGPINGKDHTSGMRPDKSSGTAPDKKAAKTPRTSGTTPDVSSGTAPDLPQFIGHGVPEHRAFSPNSSGTMPAELLKNPQREPSAPSGADAAAGAAASPSPRDLLFSEGVRMLQGMLGVLDGGARNFLGKLLKVAKDDAGLVLAKLREAERERPLDPAGWLIKAVVPFRNAGLALIAEEGSSVQAAEVAAAWERLSQLGRIGHA